MPAKHGNPASLVTFNPGVPPQMIRPAQAEDFTAGEINDPFPLGPAAGSSGSISPAQQRQLEAIHTALQRRRFHDGEPARLEAGMRSLAINLSLWALPAALVAQPFEPDRPPLRRGELKGHARSGTHKTVRVPFDEASGLAAFGPSSQDSRRVRGQCPVPCRWRMRRRPTGRR